MAARLGGTLAHPPLLQISGELELGRGLKQSGAFDEAAQVLDRAIAEGVRAPHRIENPSEFVAAEVRRATIALARGETVIARDLLARLLRDDPTIDFSPNERNPQNRAALDEIRRQLGPAPALEAADLGEACLAADVVIVGRRLDSSGAIELTRFDDCHLVSKFILSDEKANGAAVAALAKVVPAKVAAARAEHSARSKKIAGVALFAGSAVLLASGIYFAAQAGSRYGDVNRDCSLIAPCSGTTLHERVDGYQNATIAAGVLVPIGLAALITGGVLTGLGMKHHRAGGSLALFPFGAAVTGSLAW